MSLTKLHKEHQNKQQTVRASIERLRRDANASLEPVIASIVDSVSLRVAQVFANQQKIEAQLQLSQKLVDQFGKTVHVWTSTANGLNDAVKELGDVIHWTDSIKRDVEQIVTAKELANGNEHLMAEWRHRMANHPEGVPEAEREELEAWLRSD